jgi:hypothetical protein
MNTLLSPIEKPQGLIMKLAYAMTRRQFGKVITPLKVHSARLPPAFGLFYSKISKLDKKLLLPPETAHCLIFGCCIVAPAAYVVIAKFQCLLPTQARVIPQAES